MANYAVNEKGQVVTLIGGKWQKVPTAENDKGEVVMLVDGAWKPAPRRVQKGIVNSQKAGLVKRARAIGMDPQQLFVEQDPATFGEGLDKGLEDVAYGTAQLASRILPGVSSEGIDEAVAERRDYPIEGGAGVAGEVTGNIIGSFGPGGAAARTARALPFAGPVTEATVGATAEGLAMPADPDNYGREKITQTILAGGTGLGVSSALSAPRAAVGVANVPRRMENLPADVQARAVQGRNTFNTQQAQDFAAEGQRLSGEYGVDLTPGQSTGSRTLNVAEQRARESFFSAQRVADGDAVRADQMVNAIRRSSGNVQSENFAREMQGRVSGLVRNIASERSKNGRDMYGAIDRMAQGDRIVQPRAVYDALTDIAERGRTLEGGDWAKASRQARAMLETIDKQGGYTAQEALARLQAWSPYSPGDVFDDVSKGVNAQVKRQIYEALLEDMDAVAAQGGTLGDMVREANKTWRTFSEKIDAVHNSVLGKIVGEEFATDLLSFNKVSPEDLMNKLAGMKPSEARYVVDLMGREMPDMLPQLRGAVLDDALEASFAAPASAGDVAQFSPQKFLSALGLTGGKRGAQATRRLMHIFGGEGSDEWKMMKDLISLSRRLADSTGKNFSGTAAANQFWDFVRRGWRGVMNGVTVLATANKISKWMEPGGAQFGQFQARPLLTVPRVIQRAPIAPAMGAATVQAREDEPDE